MPFQSPPNPQPPPTYRPQLPPCHSHPTPPPPPTTHRWASLTYYDRNRSKCLTQAQLESSLTGGDFRLDWRYGEHMNVVYVSMLLAGGLPIAYASAAFWFITAYWVEKWELLRLSKRPIAYGSDLAHMCADMVPFAAVRAWGCGGVGGGAVVAGVEL